MAFPGTLDINYYNGDTYEFNIYPKLAGGSAMNLTDYQVQFNVSETRGSSIVKDCYAIIPTASGNTQFPNYVKCAIRPDDLKELDVNKVYYYDVEIKKSSSPYDYVYTILTGTISITDQVSRPAP